MISALFAYVLDNRNDTLMIQVLFTWYFIISCCCITLWYASSPKRLVLYTPGAIFDCPSSGRVVRGAIIQLTGR
jgi:hypothetical protein